MVTYTLSVSLWFTAVSGDMSEYRGLRYSSPWQTENIRRVVYPYNLRPATLKILGGAFHDKNPATTHVIAQNTVPNESKRNMDDWFLELFDWLII